MKTIQHYHIFDVHGSTEPSKDVFDSTCQRLWSRARCDPIHGKRRETLEQCESSDVMVFFICLVQESFWDANDSAQRGAGGSRTRWHSRWSDNDHAEQSRPQGSADSLDQFQNRQGDVVLKTGRHRTCLSLPSRNVGTRQWRRGHRPIRSVCRSLVRRWMLWRRCLSRPMWKGSMCPRWQVSVGPWGRRSKQHKESCVLKTRPTKTNRRQDSSRAKTEKRKSTSCRRWPAAQKKTQ